MTPWFRPLLILTVLIAVSSVSFPVSFLASISYAVEPSPGETRAGSASGDGRARPGRADPVPPPPPPPPPRPSRPPTPAVSVPAPVRPVLETTEADAPRRTATGPVVPALRVLPLGSGLVLIGLGLGFFAVRIRRG